MYWFTDGISQAFISWSFVVLWWKVMNLCWCGWDLFSYWVFIIYSIASYYKIHLTCRYEGAFNRLVDEINAIATYQWWEGSLYSILCILAYPLAWSWQQWRQRIKLQTLREFVRSEYDHACLRSCRSRALYEGLKVSFCRRYIRMICLEKRGCV